MVRENDVHVEQFSVEGPSKVHRVSKRYYIPVLFSLSHRLAVDNPLLLSSSQLCIRGHSVVHPAAIRWVLLAQIRRDIVHGLNAVK